MTLVIGLKGKNGIVLAADSRGTIGDPRSLTAINDNYDKLFRLTKFSAIATFGASELSSQLMERICNHKNIKNQEEKMNIEVTVEIFRDGLQRVYSDWFRQTPPKERPILGYIVGGIDNDKQGRLYTLISNSEFAPQFHTKGTAMGGVPQYATYLSHKLYTTNMSLTALEKIAVFLISETATQDPKVGGPIKLATITSNKGFVFKSEKKIEELNENNKNINKLMRDFFIKGVES